MAKVRPAPKEPVPFSYRALPLNLGRGRVCLYDSTKGVPALLDPPTAGALAKKPWLFVHFPSRRHVLVKSKAAGIELLREIHDGKDTSGVLPKLAGKKPKPAKPKEPIPARPRPRETAAEAKPPPAPAETAKEEEKPPSTGAFTPVAPGATFDQAMQAVFPAQRLTAELERLMSFRKTIFTKDGTEIGEEDEPFVQLTALKTAIAYHQGRPAEKEKPAPDKKRMSYDELEQMVFGSEAALEYMERMVKKARARRTDATTPAPPMAMLP